MQRDETSITKNLPEGQDALFSQVNLGILRVLQLNRQEDLFLSLGPLNARELPMVFENFLVNTGKVLLTYQQLVPPLICSKMFLED